MAFVAMLLGAASGTLVGLLAHGWPDWAGGVAVLIGETLGFVVWFVADRRRWRRHGPA